jgi:uncharacterized protein (DUF1697 family)
VARSSNAWIALLRGVNVGGSRKVPMADVRAAFEAAGATQVRSYVQSGNVVFSRRGTEAPVQRAIETALHERFGIPIDVVLRTRGELATVVARHPFASRAPAPTQVHVAFCAGRQPSGVLDDLDLRSFLPEAAVLAGRECYLYLPDGIGRSRLASAVDRRLAPPITVRNWRTVTTLHELASELG